MAKVSEAIAPVIAVDRKAAKPLHKQIYDGFLSVIVGGNMRPGQRVPSSRTLSVELGISRIPVLNAYAQLLAEGYFESRKGAGTFVSESLPESLTICERQDATAHTGEFGPRPVARRALLLSRYDRAPWVGGFGAFSVHQPAFDHFPFPIWSSLITRHSKAHASARSTTLIRGVPKPVGRGHLHLPANGEGGPLRSQPGNGGRWFPAGA